MVDATSSRIWKNLLKRWQDVLTIMLLEIHAQIVQMASMAGGGKSFRVTIGISVEPLTNVENVGCVEQQVQNGKLFVAQKIASDLFKFMQSFDTGTSGDSNLMVVPKNIFDRWFKRFSNRFQRDPNFFLKSDDD